MTDLNLHPVTEVGPPAVDADVLRQLREACDAAGYTEQRLHERVGPPDGGSGHEPRPVQLRRLVGDDPLATLARLFLLGVPVDEADARRALAPAELESLTAAGFVALADGRVCGAIQLAPHDGLRLFADWKQPVDDQADVVLGVNPTARMLGWLTPRRRVGSALDLGTGGGIQALLAARHAERVTGIDVNPRALAFARLNAAFNRSDTVDWQEGSWLEPVADRRFDLIVANPPFVVSPDRQLLYRDGGFSRDELSCRLISQLPAHLDDGGLALVLCNWVHPDGDWAAPLEAWVEGSGCDAVLVRYRSDDPLSYAAMWNEPRREADPAGYEEIVDRWLRHYASHGIEAIGFGLVALRRRTAGIGSTRVQALEAARYPSAPAGDHLLRMLDAVDYLDGIPGADPRLLDGTFALVNGHRVEQTLTCPDGRYHSHPARVLAVPGVGVEATVAPDVLNELFACDGVTPLRQLLAERAVTDDRRIAAVLAAVQELISLGLLAPMFNHARARGPNGKEFTNE